MKVLKIWQPLYLKIILLTLLFTNTGYTQTDDTNDLASWNTIAIEYQLNKKWSFSLEEQLRLKNNVSEIDNYFTELNAEYEIFNNFKLGGGLRYIRKNDNQGNIQGYENHFRFNFDTSYKHEIADFSLKYRLRYQNKNELGVSNAEGDYANQHLRFKTAVVYNIKKWKLDPKFSAELFHHFEKGEASEFNKYRLTLGTEYKFKTLGKIGVFYGFEKELNETIPETTNIIGLKYTYKFKNK
ncbi:DUF2490 domain-containing protein [Flavivirga aquimarina]|uniref:DUF2490 domain-containing protein n=1 Tax=Flavivirga aquimarina TaxID=2027862 RepID=A0ABT8WCD4_9FLAO|nr:DUF2490 domain-containing protein [Flavivirga aquimarina]MDO5970692.1 DUF2490 domain-containing protein [Flavivirga aquimarina]